MRRSGERWEHILWNCDSVTSSKDDKTISSLSYKLRIERILSHTLFMRLNKLVKSLERKCAMSFDLELRTVSKNSLQ